MCRAKRLRELEKEKEKKQKENEKKAKELEKERERKQKELEKKAKELEREKEKKQKEEEKKAKELEKEKQKEEKFLREEMEKKKSEKVKAAFVGFFKPKNLNTDVSKDEEKINSEHDNYFMPFQVIFTLIFFALTFLKFRVEIIVINCMHLNCRLLSNIMFWTGLEFYSTKELNIY